MTDVRIGHLSTFYHTAVVLMARERLGKPVGFPVSWRLFGTGPAIVKAFGNNELDMAFIGLPPAVIGISKGVDIICIAGGHIEGTVISGRSRSAGSPELASLGDILAQFTGLTIGTPGNGSIHDVILRESLRKAGLDASVRVANYHWAEQVLEAMVREEVAAAVGTPALAVAVRHYAGGRILCPPAQLWPYNPSYGIVARKSFLTGHPEIVERFLMLHEEATTYLREEPDKASETISDFVGVVDSVFVREVLAVSPRYCAALPQRYIDSTMGFVSVLLQLGYISREVGSAEIFDTSFISKIHTDKDHY